MAISVSHLDIHQAYLNQGGQTWKNQSKKVDHDTIMMEKANLDTYVLEILYSH